MALNCLVILNTDVFREQKVNILKENTHFEGVVDRQKLLKLTMGV